MLVQLVPFILIFIIMYFLIIRPQQKRAKDHQEMIKNVRRGDQIVTTGGLIGKVTKVIDDNELELEIARWRARARCSRHDRRCPRQGRTRQGLIRPRLATERSAPAGRRSSPPNADKEDVDRCFAFPG